MSNDLLNSAAIDQRLMALNKWSLDAHKASISKAWVFDRFQTAIHFFVKVGELSERHNHHPEFLSTYTKARIRLLTHDAHGLTAKDFDLAQEIDQLINTEFANSLQTQ